MNINVGEMDAKDLRDTCMDLNNQKSVQIKFSDVDKAMEKLQQWHSRKDKFRAYRKEFMMEYIPDLKELST